MFLWRVVVELCEVGFNVNAPFPQRPRLECIAIGIGILETVNGVGSESVPFGIGVGLQYAVVVIEVFGVCIRARVVGWVEVCVSSRPAAVYWLFTVTSSDWGSIVMSKALTKRKWLY